MVDGQFIGGLVGLPNAPIYVVATAGNGQATVNFLSVSLATSYTVTASTGQAITGASNPLTVTGLANGTPVTFTVVARNNVGSSVASDPSPAITPVVTSDWAPYAHALEVEPGSVFDFSSLLDAPAGKYGAITATSAGHFAFQNRANVPVRFVGVNLTGATNFVSHEEADILAERFALSGYNSIRMHHIDNILLAARETNSHQIDPVKMDQLDYLFAAFKNRGIYVNIDLFSARAPSLSEAATIGLDPELSLRGQFKVIAPISKPAQDLWDQFAINFMTHVNPYTGMSWAQDPALIGICPINEDTLVRHYTTYPALNALYQSAFQTWWQVAANKQIVQNDEEAGLRYFLQKTQTDADARMRTFLKGLGTKALITGTNYINADKSLSAVRSTYDYVDMHNYFDDPSSATLPMTYTQANLIGSLSWLTTDMARSRVWGKPFVVSEYQVVRPNQYRAQTGAVIPAYASLQDWDALYVFEYCNTTNNLFKPGAANYFGIATDPINLMAHRVLALSFLRRDIAPSTGGIGYEVTTPGSYTAANRAYPYAYTRLGLVTAIGSSTDPLDANRYGIKGMVTDGTADRPNKKYNPTASLWREVQEDAVIPAGSLETSESTVISDNSDTGEIKLRAVDRTMQVVSNRSELFVLHESGQTLTGNRVTVTNSDGPATITISSSNNSSIATTNRLLVMHLTDAVPQGMTFQDTDRKVVTSFGLMPHTVRSGSVTVHLRLNTARTWKAYALFATGKRSHQVPLPRVNNTWTLSAQTVTSDGVQLAYEVVAD